MVVTTWHSTTSSRQGCREDTTGTRQNVHNLDTCPPSPQHDNDLSRFLADVQDIAPPVIDDDGTARFGCLKDRSSDLDQDAEDVVGLVLQLGPVPQTPPKPLLYAPLSKKGCRARGSWRPAP